MASVREGAKRGLKSLFRQEGVLSSVLPAALPSSTAAASSSKAVAQQAARLYSMQPATGAAAAFRRLPLAVSCSRGFSTKTPEDKGAELLNSMEHATGLELAEMEGKARGVDIFSEGESWLQAPFGTPEKPVVVTSSFAERIVGVTDPEDDSIVVWDFIKEGEPPKQIVENGEFFVLKKVTDPADHYRPHTWSA